MGICKEPLNGRGDISAPPLHLDWGPKSPVAVPVVRLCYACEVQIVAACSRQGECFINGHSHKLLCQSLSKELCSLLKHEGAFISCYQHWILEARVSRCGTIAESVTFIWHLTSYKHRLSTTFQHIQGGEGVQGRFDLEFNLCDITLTVSFFCERFEAHCARVRIRSTCKFSERLHSVLAMGS